MEDLRVESFGRDCFGNISGYKVLSGSGADRVCHGTFCHDIYKSGSTEKSWTSAKELLASLKQTTLEIA